MLAVLSAITLFIIPRYYNFVGYILCVVLRSSNLFSNLHFVPLYPLYLSHPSPLTPLTSISNLLSEHLFVIKVRIIHILHILTKILG